MTGKSNNLIWGLILIALGVIFAGNAFNLWNFEIFFKGWWTLFIIVPSIIGIIKNQNKLGSFTTLIIGIFLLLIARDILPKNASAKLIFPVILVLIGLNLIFKNIWKPKHIFNSASGKSLTAVFGGQEVKLSEDVFEGSNITAIFGGIELDCKKALIKENIEINALAVFGGIDLFMPDNVNIVVNSLPIFGGVDNNIRRETNHEEPTITINATCVFGV